LNSPNNNATQSIIGRLRSELVLKLILLVVLNFCVSGPYFFLQRHHFFPARQMQPTSFDRMIPFSEQAVWLYLSLYLLIPAGPVLMNNRKQLLSYAKGIVLISLIADVVFIFWPTTCPRPAVQATNAVYQMLTAVDNPFHAFPSLHAAFAVYSALCGGRVLRELGSRGFLRTGLWLWAGSILYATLATRQHVAADILAGSALGFGVYASVFKETISICK